jgi:prepilin-type N-terminal cleavage/methylation domain-containing protein
MASETSSGLPKNGTCRKLSIDGEAVRGYIMSAPAARSRRGRQAGFTLIDLLFVIAIIGLLSTLAIPGLMRARSAAQSGSALATLRIVNSAQLSFAITCGLGFYAPDFPALGKIPRGASEAFLDPEMTGDVTFQRSGYGFSMASTPVDGTPATCNGLEAGMTGPGYALVADPLDKAKPLRNFGTNADGVLYEHTEELGEVMPESGPPEVGQPIR